jgi:hypothetical protein
MVFWLFDEPSLLYLKDVQKAAWFRFLHCSFNPLNTELNPICHLLALLGDATIVEVSRLRVNERLPCCVYVDT